MAPFETLPAARRAAVIAVLCLMLAISLCAATTVVALAGLGQLSSKVQIGRVPGWLWYYRGDPTLQEWMRRGVGIAVLAHAAVIAALARKRPKSLHGDARFASSTEIRRAGLRERDGVILGAAGGRLLRAGGRGHVFVCAPTGSGKSSGIIIPTLLSYQSGAVVLDIKGECWRQTAGLRQSIGQKVWLFEPFAEHGRTARWNPLGHIDREDPQQTFDVLQRVATILFPDHEGATEGFWNLAGRNAFIGVALLVTATSDRPLTLGEINRWFADIDLAETIKRRIEGMAKQGAPLSEACKAALLNFCGNSEAVFGSIRLTVTTRLQAWSNPLVDAATSQSDFDLSRLREDPATLYLCVAPGDLVRAAPIFSLLVELLLDHICRRHPVTQEAQPLLVLLDEFPSLGRLSVLAASFAWIGSYGVRLVCVVQNLGQLRAQYKEAAQAIHGNCDLQVYFAPNSFEDAQSISNLMGWHGQKATSRSRPSGLASGRRSQSESEQRRALMLPDELMRMPRDRLIIFARGFAPIQGRWLKAWKLRAFRRRISPPPHIPARAPMRTSAATTSRSPTGVPSAAQSRMRQRAYGREARDE
ncbi:type IV secretory system conjugative DNA transfer family protein [Caulobacter sp. 73W]|uniref:Type IV secretory system conjugative DNA transfer family protein n=1 Tax=Caulobacter sp. 73W TaxID=3161137 RepID=A0AB39KX25_9CAUL